MGSLLVALRGVKGHLGDLWRGRAEHVQQGLPLGVCVFCLLPPLRPQPLSQAGLAMREAGAKKSSLGAQHTPHGRTGCEGDPGTRGRGWGDESGSFGVPTRQLPAFQAVLSSGKWA